MSADDSLQTIFVIMPSHLDLVEEWIVLFSALPNSGKAFDESSVLGFLKTSHHTMFHHRNKLFVA